MAVPYSPGTMQCFTQAKAMKDDGLMHTPEYNARKAEIMQGHRDRHPPPPPAPAPAPASPPAKAGEAVAARPLKKHRSTKRSEKARAATVAAAERGASRAVHARERRSEGNAAGGGDADRRSQATVEAGNAAPRRHSAPARITGQPCGACASKLRRIVDFCRPALNSGSELKIHKGDQAYNYQRLKDLLSKAAFDPLGNYVVCSKCIQVTFNVGQEFTTDAHQKAKALSAEPMKQKTKKDFQAQPALVDRVVLPPTFVGSKRQYVESLPDDAVVDVEPPSSSHGLVGKVSNRQKKYLLARRLLIKFVLANRTPTGRTLQPDGRYHGTVWFLKAGWTKLRKRSPKEVEKGRINPPDDQIFSVAVMAYMTSEIERLRASDDVRDRHSAAGATLPDHRTIEIWFKEFFGIGSDLGHTDKHDHKSDACAECCKDHQDMASLKLKLKKHGSQHDQTAARRATIEELEKDLQRLEEKNATHLGKAKSAQEHYNTGCSSARRDYLKFIEVADVLLDDGDLDDDALRARCEAISDFQFQVESDYQQDKFWPSWNLSPQPGPTYFFSHITAYVQIIVSQSLGAYHADVQGDDPDKFHRNYMYTRCQHVGPDRLRAHKNSNDTASTVFHFLTGATTTGYEPASYRSGYGPDGPLDAPRAMGD